MPSPLRREEDAGGEEGPGGGRGEEDAGGGRGRGEGPGGAGDAGEGREAAAQRRSGGGSAAEIGRRSGREVGRWTIG